MLHLDLKCEFIGGEGEKEREGREREGGKFIINKSRVKCDSIFGCAALVKGIFWLRDILMYIVVMSGYT